MRYVNEDKPRSKAVKLSELMGLSDDIEDAPLPTRRRRHADEDTDADTAVGDGIADTGGDDSETEVKSLQKRDKNAAFEAAMLILSYGDNSERQLREKLTKKGFCESEIADAIERLKKLRYVDDARLMEHFAHALAQRKHFGEQRVRMEIRRRFDPESVGKYYEQSIDGIDFEECARAEAERCRSRGEDYVARRLAYLGHSASVIRRMKT